jgi:preprotein translocase subunit YajC
MKKLLIPIIIIAIIVALYEQSKADKNLWVMIVAVVIFMFGMMRLSAKIPSKTKIKMKTMFNKGDKVAVLDDDFNGVVVSVKNDEITIETEDGFVMTYFVNELIKLNETSSLENGVKSFNSNLIKQQKEIEKPRSFVRKRK